MTPSIIALIPARAGSKRIAAKNIRPFNGHPLLAYSIAAARESGIFSAIIVSTDSSDIAAIAKHYGAEVPFLRPEEMAGPLSRDIEWVSHLLRALQRQGQIADCFSILRPTSPFRTAATIERGWRTFCRATGIDSLRAVEKCRQHPAKMWRIEAERLVPVLPGFTDNQPWHSTPYQALPEMYAQNASLEIAWSRVVFDKGTIAGEVILPFFTEAYEGLDINESHDWWYAEYLVANKLAMLPVIGENPC